GGRLEGEGIRRERAVARQVDRDAAVAGGSEAVDLEAPLAAGHDRAVEEDDRRAVGGAGDLPALGRRAEIVLRQRERGHRHGPPGAGTTELADPGPVSRWTRNAAARIVTPPRAW